MRILIASKFFYPRGGAELVAIDTRRLLLSRGHDVRVHAMTYPENIPLPESGEWPGEISFRGGLRGKTGALRRVFGLDDARKRAREVIRSFEPDVVHLHNVHSYLSPALAEAAHAEGIRTVWTLHDPKLICPAGTLRGADGRYCEKCVSSSAINVLRHRCAHGSLTWSAASWIEALVWHRRRIAGFTDAFVVPSEYLAKLMILAGFPERKINVIGNPLRSDMYDAVAADSTPFSDSYFLYAGRLSREKGVASFLEAATHADVPAVVAGDGPEADCLKRQFGDSAKVTFTGRVNPRQLVNLIRKARACVLPSECGENYPLAAIEALCCGTPVIGARIGGIPEIVRAGGGFLFESGDIVGLARLLSEFHLMPTAEREALARRSLAEFAPESYLESLLKIYGKEGAR